MKVEDLLNIPIKLQSNSYIKLDDVAEVRDSFREKIGYARNNGEKAIILEVSKRTGENIIDVITKLNQLFIKKQRNILILLILTFFKMNLKKLFLRSVI